MPTICEDRLVCSIVVPAYHKVLSWDRYYSSSTCHQWEMSLRVSASDTQLYLSMPASDSAQELDVLRSCLGVAMASNRLGQANNRDMVEDYDSSKPSKYIIYLNANNLYGWAMSKPLPTHGFKWMNEEELELQ